MHDEFERVGKLLEGISNEDTTATWSQEAFQRWVNPPNRGVLADADSSSRLTGSCGDTIAIYLKFDGERVLAASFETDGCGPSVVCASLTAEMALGRKAEELLDITDSQILALAGQIPEDHHHCAFLAVSSLHEAVNEYMRPESPEK